MKNVYAFILLTLGFVVLAVGACAKSLPIDSLTANRPTLTPLPATISRISSQVALSSIQELALYADLVVTGHVVSRNGFINTARDPNDQTKPDSRFFSVNQIYQIEIDRIIKGEPPKTLLVTQNQGLITLETERSPALADIEAEAMRNEQITFVPLSPEKRYLFFLRILDKANYEINDYRSTDLYAGVAEPWRFEIMFDETIVPETLLSGVDQYFSPQPLESAIETMGEPFTPGQKVNPYPPPPGNELLPGTPYP